MDWLGVTISWTGLAFIVVFSGVMLWPLRDQTPTVCHDCQIKIPPHPSDILGVVRRLRCPECGQVWQINARTAWHSSASRVGGPSLKWRREAARRLAAMENTPPEDFDGPQRLVLNPQDSVWKEPDA